MARLTLPDHHIFALSYGEEEKAGQESQEASRETQVSPGADRESRCRIALADCKEGSNQAERARNQDREDATRQAFPPEIGNNHADQQGQP